MSFPAYSSYKDSGSDWMGKIPSHWQSKAIKRGYRVIGGSTPKSEVAGYWDGDIPWVTPSDLSKLQGFGIAETIRTITQSGLNSCGTTMVPAGSVILSTRAPIGSLGIAEVELCTNQGCKSLVPNVEQDPRFLAYTLSIASDELNIRGKGTTFLELSGDELGAFNAPSPELQEQKAIVAFLDRETSKIDALIHEQGRLIELLEEKRQAVISSVVTRGLKAGMPMKDSGVEWIGRIPDHWTVVRNKVVFQEVDERNIDGDGELMTVSHITGVTPRREKQVNMIMAESLEGYKRADRHDLVINTMWAWMGALGISPCDGLFSPSYNVYRINDKNRLLPSYYDLICRIPSHVVQIKANSTGIWESRLRLYPDVFLDMRICLPPIEEQREIVGYVKEQTKVFEELISVAHSAVQLLSERRVALISAAVTGKIDVRGLA